MNDLPPSLRRYRHRLERAVAADVARRRRRTLRLRVGAVLGATAVIALAVNLLPSGDDGSPTLPAGVEPASAVERATRALEPARGTILHVRMLGRQFDDERATTTWEDERWIRIGTGDGRVLQTAPDGSVVETEHAGGVDRVWDPQSDRVLEAAAPDGGLGAEDSGFRTEARAVLRSTPADAVVRRRAHGREVLDFTAGDGRRYVVDARTYIPIELRTRGTGGGTVLRFPVYETLGEDASEQLSIAASHPGAPAVRDTAAYRAAMERLFPNG